MWFSVCRIVTRNFTVVIFIKILSGQTHNLYILIKSGNVTPELTGGHYQSRNETKKKHRKILMNHGLLFYTIKSEKALEFKIIMNKKVKLLKCILPKKVYIDSKVLEK